MEGTLQVHPIAGVSRQTLTGCMFSSRCARATYFGLHVLIFQQSCLVHKRFTLFTLTDMLVKLSYIFFDKKVHSTIYHFDVQ